MGCTADGADQVPLDFFVPYVAAYVKGAPDDLIAHNVRLAAIDFFSRVQPIERTLAIDAQFNVHDYCLDPDDACITIRSVISVCYGGRTLRPMVEPPCDMCCGGGMVAGCGSCASFGDFHISENRDLLMFPAPAEDAEGAIKVRVRTIPGQDCCFLPKFAYDLWAEPISDGAIYRLLLMKGAPWADPALAGVFIKKHASGMGTAKTLVARRFNTGPSKLAFRRWA